MNSSFAFFVGILAIFAVKIFTAENAKILQSEQSL